MFTDSVYTIICTSRTNQVNVARKCEADEFIVEKNIINYSKPQAQKYEES